MKNVLICGAGPTGLALAVSLTKAGIPVRIIDAAAKPGTTSRATVVHARTLELYRQLGIERGVIEGGIEFKSGRLWVNGKEKARLSFGAGGVGISPYPYTIIFPQDKHEAYLVQVLDGLGVQVERSTTLLTFEETASGIRAQIQSANGQPESYEAAYLAGCDGAHSVVRHSIGTGFPGGTYEDMFYVADLRISGPLDNKEMNIALDDADFLAVFPMQGEGNVRLVGAVKHSAKDKPGLEWTDVSDSIIRRLKMTVEEVRWFSTYHVHHRVADTFRKGRAFLLGDAGHIHSPVGGQGMNTGIGDAINLAWKLAAVITNGAPEILLNTYERERIAFARKLVATTDRAFTFVNKRSVLATFVRTRLVPLLLRILFKLKLVQRAAFFALSQLQIQYRQSPLSEGKAGRIEGGDRLPWVQTNGSDNFASLAARCWQVHVYGEARESLRSFCSSRNIPLHVFPADASSSKAGLLKNAVYVVRPDGYIGYASTSTDLSVLAGYCKKWAIG